MCLGRFLESIRGTFKPIILVGSGIDMPVGRRVLVPLTSIIILLIIVNNIYKYIFI